MKNLNLVHGSKPLNRAIRNSRFEASIQDSKQIYLRSPYETGMKIDFLQVLPRAPAPVDQPGLQWLWLAVLRRRKSSPRLLLWTQILMTCGTRKLTPRAGAVNLYGSQYGESNSNSGAPLPGLRIQASEKRSCIEWATVNFTVRNSNKTNINLVSMESHVLE